MASSFTRFLDHTRRITLDRTPLDEWSAPDAENSDNTQHSRQTDIYASSGIRNHNLNRRTAADLRLRPRGSWDLPCYLQIRVLVVTLEPFLITTRFVNVGGNRVEPSWSPRVDCIKILLPHIPPQESLTVFDTHLTVKQRAVLRLTETWKVSVQHEIFLSPETWRLLG
jgi:hypothetical protein